MNIKNKKLICLFLALSMLFCLVGCSQKSDTTQSIEETTTEEAEIEETGLGKEIGTFSSDLMDIPDDYFTKLETSTPSEELKYTHGDHEKSVVVYLPPDYTPEKQYNVFYVLAGIHANETAFFNSAGEDATLKNVFDNMSVNGDTEPFIAVCMSFFPSPEKNFDNSTQEELLDDFFDELCNVIIPAVESTYSTYAKSTNKEDLIKSRKHRALAGFSLGASTTWRALSVCPEYFYYYVPMSDCSYENAKEVCNTAVGEAFQAKLDELGYTNEDFFIFATNGTEDASLEKMNELVDGFKEYYPDLFVFTDNDKAQGNITYKIKQDAPHRYLIAYMYMYNAILCMWQ